MEDRELYKNPVDPNVRKRLFARANEKHLNKVHHRYIDQKFLTSRASVSIAAGYTKQKWISFCETLLEYGFKIRLYEAYQTQSKYITVCKGGREFKVRFSNHKPIYSKERNGDCDFFVGVTNLGVTTTDMALTAVFEYFKGVK